MIKNGFSSLRFSPFFLWVLSWTMVAFGQPAWSPFLAFLTSLFGFAIFWKILLDIPKGSRRFWIGTAWFSSVQFLQLSWALSHPYYYIIGPYLMYVLLWGFQFGIVSFFIEKKTFSRPSFLFFIPALWVIMEWSRLFFLSGFPFNPVGLSLAGTVVTLQMASLFGVFGMGFWVFLTNLLFLKSWVAHFSQKTFLTFALFALLPFGYGTIQLALFSSSVTQGSTLNALLVQTAFPAEEALFLETHEKMVAHVLGKWKHILSLIAPYQNQSIDLIALPETVVPFGTYSCVYPYEIVQQVFQESLGESATIFLPLPRWPLAVQDGEKWLVNNAFWMQGLSNVFRAGIVAGLEDAEDVAGKRHYYSAAIYIQPDSNPEEGVWRAERYAKQVLVPLGEYIPFHFCRQWAACYGVSGSFTPGHRSAVWNCKGTFFGPSICYEEGFGHLMRGSRTGGAQMLLNLTSDAWFPHSKLIRQHLEHARLRTVETGVPLLRACNTGITGCIDSLGRDVSLLGTVDKEREDLSAALFVQAPLFTYSTLYTLFGDAPIVFFAFCCFFLNGYLLDLLRKVLSIFRFF